MSLLPSNMKQKNAEVRLIATISLFIICGMECSGLAVRDASLVTWCWLFLTLNTLWRSLKTIWLILMRLPAYKFKPLQHHMSTKNFHRKQKLFIIQNLKMLESQLATSSCVNCWIIDDVTWRDTLESHLSLKRTRCTVLDCRVLALCH
jgi:hypothetical protein